MDNSTFKSLRKDYKTEEIIESLLAALVFALVILLPLYIIFGELISIYMYLLTFLVVLIIISVFGFVYLFHYFWKKSLLLKKKDINTNINKLFLKTSTVINGIVLIVGLLFIFIFIPALQV